MKTEKIILSFIAILIGLLASGVAFYFYQSTKTIPPSKLKTIAIVSPAPTTQPSIFLTIDNPKDEEVTDKKIITVSGKTTPDATVILSSQIADNVINPSSTGSFSTTVTITDGENEIQITAIAPNGEETTLKQTITYSTESF